jgi:hypothetical protein
MRLERIGESGVAKVSLRELGHSELRETAHLVSRGMRVNIRVFGPQAERRGKRHAGASLRANGRALRALVSRDGQIRERPLLSRIRIRFGRRCLRPGSTHLVYDSPAPYSLFL